MGSVQSTWSRRHVENQPGTEETKPDVTMIDFEQQPPFPKMRPHRCVEYYSWWTGGGGEDQKHNLSDPIHGH
ncbi:hypothetical protein C4D60_Mb04t02400 [Musa balbisiana]|uniref:Uncharacterized protein n=1 Tax=Musa balbisiana TaxID=52838 RepID=A0A4S8K934_MUSBA|nr:hypothetical protein C4D60_Mb04t02400 [Musa balbisiana]